MHQQHPLPEAVHCFANIEYPSTSVHLAPIAIERSWSHRGTNRSTQRLRGFGCTRIGHSMTHLMCSLLQQLLLGLLLLAPAALISSEISLGLELCQEKPNTRFDQSRFECVDCPDHQKVGNPPPLRLQGGSRIAMRILILRTKPFNVSTGK